MNKNVLRNLSYGVYVVSTLNGEKATGCIANSVMQITYDTLALSLNHENFTNECIKKSNKFAISILTEKVDTSLIGDFGFKSGRDFDKFAGKDVLKIGDLSVLEDSCGYIICEVINTLETETHTVFLGKIVDGEVLKQEMPMTYAYYHLVKKGPSPKAAPTYIEPEASKSTDISQTPRYQCSVCGYIYEGEISKEPDTYSCPICAQPKNVFKKIN